MGTQLVVGTGAIGSRLAVRLAAEGHHVLAVSRRGTAGVTGDLPGAGAVEWRALDAADPGRLEAAARGADVIYNCANPPYHRWAKDWPPLHASLLGAASSTGAALVTLSNLYGYGPVPHALAETDALAATSRKGRVRAAMWHDALARHRRGELRATELRASDYFGPGAGTQAVLGSRVVPNVLDGRTVRVLGDPDAPHSWTYTADVVEALVVAGRDERALGRAWHVPTCAPVSIREAVRLLACAAGLPTPRVGRIPWSVVRAAGLAAAELRELPELAYQFDAPFVVDSRAFQATFGVEPTPLPVAMAATVAWWRDRRGFPLPRLEARGARR